MYKKCTSYVQKMPIDKRPSMGKMNGMISPASKPRRAESDPFARCLPLAGLTSIAGGSLCARKTDE